MISLGTTAQGIEIAYPHRQACGVVGYDSLAHVLDCRWLCSSKIPCTGDAREVR